MFVFVLGFGFVFAAVAVLLLLLLLLFCLLILFNLLQWDMKNYAVVLFFSLLPFLFSVSSCSFLFFISYFVLLFPSLRQRLNVPEPDDEEVRERKELAERAKGAKLLGDLEIEITEDEKWAKLESPEKKKKGF